MRSALFALPVLLALASAGCADPASEDAASSTNDLVGNDAPLGDRECVIDTIVTKNGLIEDFAAAVGRAYIHDYGGSFYPHIEIPGFFDAAIAPNEEFGEWFYTIIGFDHQPELLASGEDGPRMTAILRAGAFDDPSLTTAAHRYEAAQAIFGAMPRAKETTTEHHAHPHTFDQSWKIVRRESPNGRVVCEAQTNPDTAETRPVITCTFLDIERTTVQIFNTRETGGKCLAK